MLKPRWSWALRKLDDGSFAGEIPKLKGAARSEKPCANVKANCLHAGRNWRREGDSNPRYGFWPYNGLANHRLQPLGHLSNPFLLCFKVSIVFFSFSPNVYPVNLAI